MHTSQEDTQVIVHPEALELAELLRPTWPAFSDELRLRPTLVCEGDDDGNDDGSDDGNDDDGSNDDSGGGDRDGNDDGDDGLDERAKAKIQKANREAQNLRKRLKELEPLAKKAKELEDANKTEVEKATERATSAEDRATTAEAKALRLEVALDKAPDGMPIAQVRKWASRLKGTSQEELEADAEELFADFAPNDDDDQESSASRRPRERLRPGGASGRKPEETDPKKLAESVPRSY